MSHWEFKNLRKNRRVKVLVGLLFSTFGVFTVAYLIDKVLG
jgi:hypothetical protein